MSAEAEQRRRRAMAGGRSSCLKRPIANCNRIATGTQPQRAYPRSLPKARLLGLEPKWLRRFGL
eukprot:15478948-Alexandrium_andersonii.AAC.1